MDEATKAFFRRQQEDEANQTCVDGGGHNPQWASVSHGCYISIEASGVHRSLGVHISFVRSTTMDSWKPAQLRLMELGGNRRLKACFKEHGVPEDAPITEKYNTRAADWYRKNLRALAEGTDAPPPLPEGTGHLPLCAEPSAVQIAMSNSPPRSMISAGGAFASDARNYGGYHGGGYHVDGQRNGNGYTETSGIGGDTEKIRNVSSGKVITNPSFAGLGWSGSARSGCGAGASEDFLSGILGAEATSKVSTGMWGAVGTVRGFASKSKSFVETKVAKAQQDGWVDTVVDVAKQGASVAVDTSAWAAHRGVEAGKTTITYVNEGGGKQAISKTGEALGGAARTSLAVINSGADWVSDQLVGSTHGKDNAAGLQKMSTGKMQGFGSDCAMPGNAARAGQEPSVGGGSQVSEPTMEFSPAPSTTDTAVLPTLTPSTTDEVRASAPMASNPKAAQIWNADEWGEWN
eukprot:TRINITY_DN12080_c0_g1_i1.p1 TRINITY_DN12080_c0_g1~~TRINITY_DN12080_c0_g1_i1.p1  ORF type:complete len:482 (+),score=80.96 TRINITY_DN12080_c0_g1_i1:63-1448(+)